MGHHELRCDPCEMTRHLLCAGPCDCECKLIKPASLRTECCSAVPRAPHLSKEEWNDHTRTLYEIRRGLQPVGVPKKHYPDLRSLEFCWVCPSTNMGKTYAVAFRKKEYGKEFPYTICFQHYCTLDKTKYNVWGWPPVWPDPSLGVRVQQRLLDHLRWLRENHYVTKNNPYGYPWGLYYTPDRLLKEKSDFNQRLRFTRRRGHTIVQEIRKRRREAATR